MWLKLSTLRYGGWSGLSGRPNLVTWGLTRKHLLCLWLESDADVSVEGGSGRCDTAGCEDGERGPKPRETVASVEKGKYRSAPKAVTKEHSHDFMSDFSPVQRYSKIIGFPKPLSRWQLVTAAIETDAGVDTGSRRCCIRYLKCGGGLELGFGKRLEELRRAWIVLNRLLVGIWMLMTQWGLRSDDNGKGYINGLKGHLIVVKILSMEGKVTIGENSEWNELLLETEE